jgi:aspartate racemase
VTALRADTLGVLGGMGPLSTADFVTKLTRLTPAATESEHIPLIVLSAPDIPDRVGPILTGAGPSPLPHLIARRKLLEDAGARAIAMPCNTAHHWARAMMDGSPLPLIGIVDATLTALDRLPIRPDAVGLIATAGTVASGFYQRRLAEAGIGCILPSDGEMTDAVVRGIALVKRNRIEEAAQLFVGAIGRLLDAGAATVVLACTEVDLALSGAAGELREKCLDTNRALAQACIDWALDQRRQDR